MSDLFDLLTQLVGERPSALFDLFGTLRTSAPASGLFVVDLNASGVQATQRRRLGKLTATRSGEKVWAMSQRL
jgi:hypothetical protein